MTLRILITGAAGMIGQKLTRRLLNDKMLRGRMIAELHLHDVVAAPPVSSAHIKVVPQVGNLSDRDIASSLAKLKPDVIFHLAGVVSGDAEQNFDLGYSVNFDGLRHLLEALRGGGCVPRVVFSSSIAVYGAPFPDVIPDEFHLTPRSSYGVQKMMGEALVADYSRKGFIDGIGLRLPTICVRPGKPNKAASGFFSNIIREPLDGKRAILPVPRDVVHSFASPQSAVGFLIHAANLDQAALPPYSIVTMPGIGCSVSDLLQALSDIAGPQILSLIDDVPDAAIWAIVKNWPTRFAATKARDLGFVCETHCRELILAHIASEQTDEAAL